MSKYESDTVRIIQLATLSALVDGQASDAEIDVLVTATSERCAIEADDARALATKMIERYASKQLAADPVSLVRHGKNAMRRLSGRQRKLALEIATQVAAASPGGEAAETKFLRQLERVARA